MPQEARQTDTLEEIRHKIWDHNTVQTALDDEKPVLYDVVDRGRQLLQGVTCPELDVELTEFADHWVQINTDTSAKLKRWASV